MWNILNISLTDLVLGNNDAMGPSFSNIILHQPKQSSNAFAVRVDAGASFDLEPQGKRGHNCKFGTTAGEVEKVRADSRELCCHDKVHS